MSCAGVWSDGRQSYILPRMRQASNRKQDGASTKQEMQVPLRVLDLLLGVAVAFVIAGLIAADQGGRRDPDAIAYLFACAFGGLMLVRRRFPVAMLVVTMLLLSAYYILDYPAIGLAVPIAAALYSAAEFGHLTAPISVSLFLDRLRACSNGNADGCCHCAGRQHPLATSAAR
jgi:hypothetical protein